MEKARDGSQEKMRRGEVGRCRVHGAYVSLRGTCPKCRHGDSEQGSEVEGGSASADS